MTNEELIKTLLQWPGALATAHNGPYVTGWVALAYPELVDLVRARRTELRDFIKGDIAPKGRYD